MPANPNFFRSTFTALLITLAITGGCRRPAESESVSESLAPNASGLARQLADRINAGEWESADKLAQAAMIANPQDPDVLTNAARVAASLDRKREAAHLLVDAAKAANFRPESRVEFAVQALIDVGESYGAIELLEQSLAVVPESDRQRRILVGFLGEVQRPEKVPEHLEQLIRNRAFDVHLLAGLTETSTRRFSASTAEELLRRNPDDRRVRLAEAVEHFEDHDVDAAASVLEEILEHHPEFTPAHAMYGRAVADQGDLEKIEAWLRQAPEQSEQYADYWLALGKLLSDGQRFAAATRANAEAARRDPNSVAAWWRLSCSIGRMQRSGSEYSDVVTPSQLTAIRFRLFRLMRFRHRYEDFETSDKQSQRLATEIAESLLKLGRLWEAEAWSAVATTLSEDPAENLPALRRKIAERLRREQSWVSESSLAPAEIDLTKLPDPIESMPTRLERRRPLKPSIAGDDHLRMVDQSDRWGLGNVGADNNPDDSKLSPLIRTTGAGGGVIDFDLDGLPDIVVMGAGGTKRQQDSKPNELMRHLGDHFVPVTDWAGVFDRGYGQGVAVGDVNEDGFPDLFFANIGKNKLLGNNGDGTFSDWSDRLGGTDPQGWSTCGVFVDINSDAITDLLTTNYCDADASIEVGCPNEDGIPGPCPPPEYPADDDQFFLGTDSGRLVDVTARWVEDVLPGRGLGILAGRLDGLNQGVYVANDMTENAYYSAEAGATAREFAVRESAVARGVAVDSRTLAQASMGIAASDFDLDGDLDLYVTGFSGEYNILYEQVAPGLWSDETAHAGLVRPTLDVLGFGTQAIDLDGDGIDEIIVTNGHIEDFPNPGALPYHQPLQIFRRGSSSRFHLVADDHWGNYFEQHHVGRALWKVDVDDDGWSDVMITHAAEPVRLLVNQTRSPFNRIGFRLVGTACSRDAIGAIVTFRVGDQQRRLWLLAGDGYLCSNQRVLRAGLEGFERVSDVQVNWPDGSLDRFDELPANRQFLIIQGSGQAHAERLYEKTF